MIKYKFIGSPSSYGGLVMKNHEYSGNHDLITTTVEDMANRFAKDWKKVETPTEDVVNHPKHYKNYPVEAIDMMIAIWGKEAVADYCLMNAFKYRMRLGLKDNLDQDLDKEKWYLNKYKDLID